MNNTNTYAYWIGRISELVTKYKPVRETGTINDVQELRDDLSEALFWFGPIQAQLRADAERAEAIYKSCIEEKSLYWKEKYSGARGTADMVKSKAVLDCRELQDKLISANEQYYLSKSLLERTDQILNSLSSRIKIVNKNE
jgi:hypothetical protein